MIWHLRLGRASFTAFSLNKTVCISVDLVTCLFILAYQDNNIDFWRKYVSEYFGPHAKKRWCVSLYGYGRQTTGVFPQVVVFDYRA